MYVHKKQTAQAHPVIILNTVILYKKMQKWLFSSENYGA